MPKWKSEAVNRKKDNTLKKKRTIHDRQNTMQKNKRWSIAIPTQNGGSGSPEEWAIPAPQMMSVGLLLNTTNIMQSSNLHLLHFSYRMSFTWQWYKLTYRKSNW